MCQEAITIYFLTLYPVGEHLYYIGDTNKGPRKCVTSEEEVCDILRQYHCGLGGHSGINNTQKKISLHLWWSNMKKDVREFVST